jgi:hypothetical protein
MATQIPVVLLGTSPNFTGIGELQTADTLTGVFNHADLTSNSIAAKIGTTAASLPIANNSLVGRVSGGNLGSLNGAQLSTLMETVLDRAGSGFSQTGQFVAYDSTLGFIAVAPGTDGEALVFDSTVTGGIASSGIASQLNGLSDVTLTAVADGQILRYSNAQSKFINENLSADTLSDVDLSTPPTDGQVLAWDNANSVFVPADQTGSGGGSFDPASDLADVAGNPIGNAQSLTLSSGSSLTEATGELTLTSSTTQVTVDDALKVNTLGSVATPTNVVTSTAGVLGSSSVADLAAQVELDDLKDFDLTGLTTGQTISWSGSAWNPASVASQLNGLSDVTLTSPALDQVLVHDGAGTFANRLLSLDDLSDVDLGVGAITNGNILTYNSTNSRFEVTAPAATGFAPGQSFGGANLPDVGDITMDTGLGTDHRIENDGANNLLITSASGTVLFAGAIELGSTSANVAPTQVATLLNGVVNSSTPGQVVAQASLADLSDVSGTAPSNGEALVYNGVAWAPATVSGGGGGVGPITSDLDMQQNYLIDYPDPITAPNTTVNNVAFRANGGNNQIDSADLDALPESAAGDTTDELFFKASNGNLTRLALESLPAHEDAGAAATARSDGELWTASGDNYLGLPAGTLVTGPSSAVSGPAAAAETPQMGVLWAMNRYGDSLGMEVPPSGSGRHTPTARVATANIPTEAFSDGLTVKCETSGTFVPGSANPGLTLGFVFGDGEVYTNGEHSESVTNLYPPVTGIRGFGGATQSLYTDETAGILASYLNLGTNALWHGYDAETGRGNELLWNCDATLTFEGGISTASRVRVRGELSYNRPLDNMSSTSSIVQGRRNVFDLRDDFPALFGLSVLPGARASVGGQEYFPYAKLSSATGFTKLDLGLAPENLHNNYLSLSFSAALTNGDTITLEDGLTPQQTFAAASSGNGHDAFTHGSTAADTAAAVADIINHAGMQIFARLEGTTEVRVFSRDRGIQLTDAIAPASCSNTTDCTVTGWNDGQNIDNRAIMDRMLNVMPGIGEDWRRYWYPRVERIPFDFVKEVDTTQEGLSLALVAGGATQTNSSDSQIVTWTAGLDTPIAGASTKFAGAGIAGLYTGGTSETPNELYVHENYVANFTVDGTTYNTRIRYDGKQIAQGSTQADNYIFSYASDMDVRTVPGENHDGRTEGVQAAGATSIVLEAGDGANFYTSGGYALINNVEVIQYTGVSTDTLTGVTRGVAGTPDQEHADQKNVINVAVGTLKREVGSGGNVQSAGSDAQFVFSNFTNTNSANPLVFHDGLMWVSRVESNLYDSQNAPSTAENQPGTFDWRPLAADGADQMTVTSSFAWMIGGRVGQTD